MKRIALFIMILVSSGVYAEDKFDANENEYFSNPDAVVETKKSGSTNLNNTEEKKTLGFSGQILSILDSYTSRGLVLHTNKDSNDKINPYVLGTADLDARLTGNFKGYASADVAYYPYYSRTETDLVYNSGTNSYTSVQKTENTTKTSCSLKEMFVDFNYDKAVYFRAGKQVLQWGRCYLWNPTDVINIEKTHFIGQLEQREGTYGLKISIPFGTSVNMYGFADMYQVDDISEVAGAYKLEFLLGNTEMAFSVWGKKGYHPVAGYDFSTRIFGWDLVGEATASNGSNSDRIRVVNGSTLETYREDGKFTPKAAIDFGREFDGKDVSKRYSLKFEFFYNGEGYSDNILNDTALYSSVEYPIQVDKKTYIMGQNLYQPNYFSRYYAAIFTTVNKVFISELTFNLNAISNLTDKSFIVAAGFTYQNINDFKAGITLYTFLGKSDCEYTVSSNAGFLQVYAGIIF